MCRNQRNLQTAAQPLPWRDPVLQPALLLRYQKPALRYSQRSLPLPVTSLSGRKQPSFQSLLYLLISHNRSKRGCFLKRYIPINSCCFSVDWSINWCKWCRSFYPHSRNATYPLDTLLYSLLKYESRPSNSDCLSSFVTSV